MAPTLILRGEDSWALADAAAQRMVKRLGDEVCIQIDGAGHDLGVQQPDEVATEVAGFLTAG